MSALIMKEKTLRSLDCRTSRLIVCIILPMNSTVSDLILMDNIAGFTWTKFEAQEVIYKID